jgi:Na+/melibiose symporter-like transporter
MKIIKSKEHYIALIKDVTEVNNQLAGMNTTLAPDFLDNEMGTIENGIVPLKKQTPYTLLMMRVVEIGLPFLLSILSIFLVLRYSLTEKRSREIKDLLNLRNSERTKEENNTEEPSIV